MILIQLKRVVSIGANFLRYSRIGKTVPCFVNLFSHFSYTLFKKKNNMLENNDQ